LKPYLFDGNFRELVAFSNPHLTIKLTYQLVRSAVAGLPLAN